MADSESNPIKHLVSTASMVLKTQKSLENSAKSLENAANNILGNMDGKSSGLGKVKDFFGTFRRVMTIFLRKM